MEPSMVGKGRVTRILQKGGMEEFLGKEDPKSLDRTARRKTTAPRVVVGEPVDAARREPPGDDGGVLPVPARRPWSSLLEP